MPPMPEPCNTTGEELLQLRNFVAELAARHNSFVVDTTKDFYNTAATFERVSAWSVEADRKLACCESTFVGHDQRIASNDVWLKSVH